MRLGCQRHSGAQRGLAGLARLAREADHPVNCRPRLWRREMTMSSTATRYACVWIWALEFSRNWCCYKLLCRYAAPSFLTACIRNRCGSPAPAMPTGSSSWRAPSRDAATGAALLVADPCRGLGRMPRLARPSPASLWMGIAPELFWVVRKTTWVNGRRSTRCQGCCLS